jgi:GDP-L-fucose synthase
MAGSAIVRRLETEGCELLAVPRSGLDLRSQAAVEAWLDREQPHAVFLAAAKVGGIHANSTFPADFLYGNLVIETNVIHAAYRAGVEKLLFLGSSCIYPRTAEQPMREEMLLTGPFEPTNEWYAMAKVAGLKLCQAYRKQHGCDFISIMPTNLFGPGDNFHPENSHVPAALLQRFHDARLTGANSVTVWGTGTPRREFLYVDDMADACVFLMKNYSGEGHINAGTGTDITIAEFADAVKRTVGYEGDIVFDTSRPDGMPRKVMDITRIRAMGWAPTTPLDEALRRYYRWFLDNSAHLRT